MAGRVALLSFRAPFGEALLGGRKPVEFRRGACRIGAGDRILVYETAPVGHVTGVARIGASHAGTGAELSRLESSPELAGPTADYLDGAPTAVALTIAAVERLDRPVPLDELGLTRPPRSYVWLPTRQEYPADLAAALERLRAPG